jgi:thiol-disulfide isomerase/thioredoxin
MKALSKRMAAVAAAAVLTATSAAGADGVQGRWDATITVDGTAIPFRLDVEGEGAGLRGVLYNGADRQFTTSATLEEDGTLVLDLGHYLTTIVASERNGALDGKVQMRNDRSPAGSPFHAVRHVDSPALPAGVNIPVIDGVWEIPHESPKGEKAWRFIVEQNGAEASAAILRVDGDTGSLTGRYRDGRFVLSHFDGSRPSLIEVAVAADGSLSIVQKGSNRDGQYVAYRPERARAKGLPEPSDYNTHTTMRDPDERFTFAFPDVDGHIVSNEDPRFKGKVVVAIVTGTWCPNCHDEAQYLVQLDEKYRDRGLAIVALDFEEPEQQDSLDRVRAFTRQYGVKYTYLIAGAPAEMWEKVPGAVNLNTWPATFFVGKDGRVKNIHAGFAAPASGVFHEPLKDDVTSTIERRRAVDPTPTTQQQ